MRLRLCMATTLCLLRYFPSINLAIALSYPPRVRVRATVKLSAMFFHDESSITIGGGGYESAIAPMIVQTTAIRHCIFFFSFSVFIQYRISKSVVICSFCSFLFFSPLFSILLFSILLSICYSMFCFFSRCLFALFSDLPYCFLFKSVILSFLCSVCFSLMLYSY